MTISYRRTTLSMDMTIDGEQASILEMADTDVRTIEISAGEPITAADAEIVLTSDPDTPLTGIIAEPITVGADAVTLTVSGLTRGLVYELAVWMTRANGTVWTGTLAITCVA